MYCVKGFTLLEVLISLFLLAISMLGVTAVSVKSLQASRALYYFQQAEWLAGEMAEYMSVHNGNHGLFINEWRDEIHLLLPNANGDVRCDRVQCRVSVNWGGDAGFCRQQTLGVSGCVIVLINL